MEGGGVIRGLFHREKEFSYKRRKVEMLKEYKEPIDRESKGVSERIKELQSEK